MLWQIPCRIISLWLSAIFSFLIFHIMAFFHIMDFLNMKPSEKPVIHIKLQY